MFQTFIAQTAVLKVKQFEIPRSFIAQRTCLNSQSFLKPYQSMKQPEILQTFKARRARLKNLNLLENWFQKSIYAQIACLKAIYMSQHSIAWTISTKKNNFCGSTASME